MKIASLFAVAALMVAVATASPFLKPAWTVTLPSLPSGNPVVALGGNNYFVNDINGTVWSINIATQKIQWSLRWDDLGALLAYPDQDTLLVLVLQGTWGVRASTGELLWVNNTVQPGSSGVAAGKWLVGYVANGAGITQLTCYDVRTGQIHWAVPSASFTTAVPVTIGGIVLVVNGTETTMAFSADDGALVWSGAYNNIIGAANGVVAILNNTNTSSPNPWFDLFFLDPATGAVKAKFLNYTQSQSVLVVFDPNGNIVVSDSVTFITAFDSATFNLVWTTNLTRVASLPFGVARLVMGPTAIIAVSNTNTSSEVALFNLTSFHRDTGALKWNLVYPPTASGNPVIVLGKYVFVPNVIGYIVVSEATGDIVFKTYSGAMPIEFGTQFPIGTSGSSIVAQTTDGSVSAFDF